MNKKELVEYVALEQNAKKKDAKELTEAILWGVVECLQTFGTMTIRNFGTFKLVTRAARKGRNPATGEELDIPETTVVRFKAAKELKESSKNSDLQND